ncbi:VWA domain-containing protein [Uliginosibacterium sp. H3]|uniref:VWA domain-containing protein n=1 Tax=Uliginosibacterium silvisoli TaxID=3114758 RepID=A0ABU6K3T7_9RHOO|nr:VWA domain-containing protein [Uliginosibacterium sp. H3]
MLQFDALWALILLPLPLLAWWLLPPYRERTQALRLPFFEEAAEAAGAEPRPGAVVMASHWVQKLLAPVCWLLIVAAAARPVWVDPPIERVEPARDLMLAIDLSQSMEATDFTNAKGQRVDRLTAVKEVVHEFIERRKTDRIGLVVFGASAFPQAPLTLDHESVELLLDELRIGMAGPQTAIGDAIGVAARMVENSKAQEKVLILLTDGNDTASRVPPERAAEAAKVRGLIIHTIGIGNPNATGEDKVDLGALQKLSTATGGRSFRGENRAGLEEIYATLDRITPEKAKREVHRPKRELFHVPLGAVGSLLVAYHLLAGLLAAMRALTPGARRERAEEKAGARGARVEA